MAIFKCKMCGGQLQFDEQQEFVECSYCGTNFSTADLLNESDAVRIEKIKSHTYKEVETAKIELEAEKERYQQEKAKQEQEKEELQKFKKSKFSKVLIAFSNIVLKEILHELSGVIKTSLCN